jgi:hypothetical protein
MKIETVSWRHPYCLPMLQLYLKALKIIVTTPRLWATILFPLILFIICSVALFVLLLACALYPQAKLFMDWFPKEKINESIAWIIAISLVILESSIGTVVLQLLILRKSQDRIFDFIIEENRGPEMVQENVEWTSWSSQLQQLLAFVVTLPVGAIPVIGPVLYVLANGYLQGPVQHARYFKQQKWTRSQIDEFVARNRSGYTLLGIYTTILELIPFINILGIYLNAVVSALYLIELLQ